MVRLKVNFSIKRMDGLVGGWVGSWVGGSMLLLQFAGFLEVIMSLNKSVKKKSVSLFSDRTELKAFKSLSYPT